MLTHVDLFSGTGAFTYAFEKTKKIKTVFANDILESSKQIYSLNNDGKVFVQDNIHNIHNENIPKHDILTAGFSCQPFSIAGKQQGFEDTRSNVFWKILDILDYHKPKIVILENVKNLKTHNKGATYNTIKTNLEQRDYIVNSYVLNSLDFGLIQNRERIFIICTLKSFRDKEFDFTKTKKYKETTFHDFIIKDVLQKYYYTSKSKIYDELVKNVIKKETFYQYRRYYVRENKKGNCPTLTENMGSGGHNVPIIIDDKGIRKLTPQECFLIQGFPKNYNLSTISDAKLYSLVGNSVSIPVVSFIIDCILEQLKN